MTDRYFRSGSGIIKTIPELLDARDQRHRIYEVHGTTDTGIVSLRYSPLPLMSRAPVGAPPADDWAAIEETLRAEVKERGCFPHPKHHDPQWHSVRAVARSFARNDESRTGAAFETARKQIAKIFKRLRREL
jgi:hypothetical protein